MTSLKNLNSTNSPVNGSDLTNKEYVDSGLGMIRACSLEGKIYNGSNCVCVKGVPC